MDIAFCIFIIKYFLIILRFAAAFPVAPLAAFANNLIGKENLMLASNSSEMRTDALKLLTGFQRPHPRFPLLRLLN